MIKKHEYVEYLELKKELNDLRKALTSSQRTISSIISALASKADKTDIISQINISPESILISGKKLHITSETMIDDKVLAEKSSSGTINADKAVGKTLRDIFNTK
ncbi:hypothetical protein [Liquorilactobacillus satsumensis]|uniref:hypothetical protein n=1 Tax=Liquorilactobacillus satsumensis TaxID=259059 RepID=UPI0039EAFD22